MDGNVLVSLLETIVLAHVVQVVAADHNCARHLGLDDDAGEDAAADRDVAGERTLLVNIGALGRL